jgi:hypothetical protein
MLRNVPRAASSSTDQIVLEGLRMVMATQPSVVAGGNTICIRSPPGNEADSNGQDSSIR